jgi:hypothetical protein
LHTLLEEVVLALEMKIKLVLEVLMVLVALVVSMALVDHSLLLAGEDMLIEVLEEVLDTLVVLVLLL